MGKESDHRTDELRNWDLWDLSERELLAKGEGDLYRVYQDHQNFEVWSRRDGLVTALPTEEQAKIRMDNLTASQAVNFKTDANGYDTPVEASAPVTVKETTSTKSTKSAAKDTSSKDTGTTGTSNK